MTDRAPNWRIAKSTTPPFDHLNDFNRALDILEEIGPRFDTGKKLELLDGALFNGPRLRSAVEGVALRWTDGSSRLQQRILELIPVNDATVRERLDQFSLLQQQRANLNYTEDYRNELPAEWVISNGLVFVKVLNANSITRRYPKAYCYAKISKDWARFFVELGEVYHRVDQLRLRSLSEGRVLCFTASTSGWQMHMPDEWLEGRKRPNTKGAKYLLTRDLPDQLLFKNLSKTERDERQFKATAMRWLYEQYKNSTFQDSSMAKTEMLKQISSLFGVRTQKILEEVWIETPISNWRKPGRKKNDRTK